jgi:hypothetical protein
MADHELCGAQHCTSLQCDFLHVNDCATLSYLAITVLYSRLFAVPFLSSFLALFLVLRIVGLVWKQSASEWG